MATRRLKVLLENNTDLLHTGFCVIPVTNNMSPTFCILVCTLRLNRLKSCRLGFMYLLDASVMV